MFFIKCNIQCKTLKICFKEHILIFKEFFMNKLGLVLTLCLGLAFSPLCALESTSQKNAHNAQNTSLSQADAAFLFTANANNLNVVALSDEEMRLIEG